MTAAQQATWQIQHDGRELGPITTEQLLRAVVSGHVTGNTLVRQGNSQWMPASQVKGLFEKAAQMKASSSLSELQKKQQKLEQVVQSLIALKKREQELRKRSRNRRLLVSSIRGTFLAFSLFSRYGDFLFSDQDDSSSFEHADPVMDDALVDELFNDFYETINCIDLSNPALLVESIDVSELSLFDLEATQAELNCILAASC